MGGTEEREREGLGKEDASVLVLLPLSSDQRRNCIVEFDVAVVGRTTCDDTKLKNTNKWREEKEEAKMGWMVVKRER